MRAAGLRQCWLMCRPVGELALDDHDTIAGDRRVGREDHVADEERLIEVV